MAAPVPNERLIGYRMQADQSFASRVREAGFTSSEWELIMSVVEFEIVDPSTPADAEMRPVMDELDKAIAATDQLSSSNPYEEQPDDGGIAAGFVNSLRGRLGLSESTGVDRDKAVMLVSEYAALLEGLLRQESAWADLCKSIAEDA